MADMSTLWSPRVEDETGKGPGEREGITLRMEEGKPKEEGTRQQKTACFVRSQGSGSLGSVRESAFGWSCRLVATARQRLKTPTDSKYKTSFPFGTAQRSFPLLYGWNELLRRGFWMKRTTPDL